MTLTAEQIQRMHRMAEELGKAARRQAEIAALDIILGYHQCSACGRRFLNNISCPRCGRRLPR